MADVESFQSIPLARNDDPQAILKAFADKSIFALTHSVYLPMSDGVCRPIACRTDDYKDHYPVKGVGVHRNPSGQDRFFLCQEHTDACPEAERHPSMPLDEYRAEFQRLGTSGTSLRTCIDQLKSELQAHFQPILKLAEHKLGYDLQDYGLSLARNRHSEHRKLFRQVLNGEVDLSPCLRQTFVFLRETPLNDASRATHLWPLRHALSTIKTFLRILSESLRTLDSVLHRVRDVLRWDQDHGGKAEFQAVEKGSPLFLEQFHAESWEMKIRALHGRCDEEWQAEKELGRGAASEHGERSLVSGLSRKLSSDTPNSLAVANEREQRP